MGTNNFSRVARNRFGAANAVTAFRAVCVVFVLAVGLAVPGSNGRWIAVAVASVALLLDGLDGFLARRLDQVSAFGARFDMETDAFAMLVLSVLVTMVGQAGPWVLLSGLSRYIFIVGGWVLPVLAAPLPAKKRRQTVCVVQMAALILALAPPVTPAMGAWICLAGLILLGYSFAVDTVWLVWHGRMENEAVG